MPHPGPNPYGKGQREGYFPLKDRGPYDDIVVITHPAFVYTYECIFNGFSQNNLDIGNAIEGR
jgi:hypothetical protein